MSSKSAIRKKKYLQRKHKRDLIEKEYAEKIAKQATIKKIELEATSVRDAAGGLLQPGKIVHTDLGYNHQTPATPVLLSDTKATSSVRRINLLHRHPLLHIALLLGFPTVLPSDKKEKG